jgi:hypothetical protein
MKTETRLQSESLAATHGSGQSGTARLVSLAHCTREEEEATNLVIMV